MAFGTRALAGPYAGLGVAIGSNREALAQALALPNVEWVAVTPAHPFDTPGKRRVFWRPPELGAVDAVATVERYQAAGWVEQAESPPEYVHAIERSKTRQLLVRRGLVTNSPEYSPIATWPVNVNAGTSLPPRIERRQVRRWRRGWVAMPELYVNVQDNLRHGEYIAGKYRETGAACVVPWFGAWSNGNDAAAAYLALRGLFPGVCLYAGEDPIDAAVLAVAPYLP